MNMKNCGCCNFRKHREIKVSYNYVTLDMLLKFDSLYKINITYSESKDNLGRSEKGLITSLGLKAKARPKKYKKARFTIGNVSKKNLSIIIREFEKLPYDSYERKRLKHEPTDSYFYLARQPEKCMMRADVLNSENYPVRMEINDTKQILTSHDCSTDDSELKEFLIDETLSRICSTEEDK